MSLFDYLKNIFFIILFLQIAPPLFERIKKQYSHYIENPAQVGVVTINNEIKCSNRHSRQLNAFFKDDAIKAIVIHMESGGGSAGTSKALYDEIMALKKEHRKPIITLVENACASGAYYIACATDYIIAPSLALIGNIGTTIPLYPSVDKLLESYKVHQENISTGTYKMAGSPLLELTEKQREHLLSVTKDSYDQFIDDVAKQRKLSLAQHLEWADGKVFTARQALKLGLVDAVGCAQDAIKVITQKAMITGSIEWIHPPKESPLSTIFGDVGQGDDEHNSLFTYLADKLYTALRARASAAKLTVE